MTVSGRLGRGLLAALTILATLSIVPAYAAVPQAPGYTKATLKVIVDNDYAAFLGSDSNVTRLFNQNNVDWMSQISNATSLDIYPQTGETYLYLAVMGGGGGEDVAGNLNGLDIVTLPGAQVASGRSPLGTASVNGSYLLLQSYISGYNTGAVAAGTQDVTLANLQTALTGVTWSSAVSVGAGSGNVPNHKTSGVCCGGSATGAGLSGKGWGFPSDSLVVFRYPVSALGLPVQPGNSRVTVDWDAPAAGDAPSGYILQYKKTSDPDSAYTTFSTPTAPTTIETVTGLTNGITYSFRVAGTNVSGAGAYSAVREATPVGPPPTPTALVVTPKSSSVEIAFIAPISNGGATITNYEYSTNGGSTWSALSPTDVTSPVTISGLTDGNTYSMRIRAVNSYGSGTQSDLVSGIPGLVARLSGLTYSNSPSKGILTSLTISLNVAGRVTFFIDGKRIAGCLKLSSTGSGSSISATCAWKPTVMGRHTITIQHVPTDNSYSSGSLVAPAIHVLRRTTTR